jgi:hypothetical protein
MKEGLTYPQEDATTLDSFTSYFFGGGVIFVGIVNGADETEEEGIVDDGRTLEEARAGRDWERCLGGFYYVSHHICIVRAWGRS